MIRHLILDLALIGLAPGSVAAAEVIGSAYAITGTVTGQPPAQARHLLSTGSKVHFNERVQARPSGKGQFRFVGGSRFVVGGGSVVVLDEFVFNGNAVRARLGITKGTLRFLGSGARSGRDEISITTPVAVVGIRGTVVDVTHHDGRTAFLLLHGSAQVCRRGGACQLVTEPCTGVMVESGVSAIQRRDASALENDFPLLAAQSELWPDYRVDTTCGVSAKAQPVERGGGTSEGQRGGHSGSGQSGGGGGVGSTDSKD
ncbi:FecR domain-containing protein [Breoghania sp.]|uniref:FecR family protein n=1 Tax=Breoghania sp. TaxID=2065378 RepID=UPI002635720E|nr:FecR domain-containing protein [Breoghania sp.]MDJ0930944.1 FecR domain-containing protein [Breoghania sp.]